MIKLQEKETAQETFDFVVNKLREQGVPSMLPKQGAFESATCVYGEPGGTRCAAGHLMGDWAPVGEYTENGRQRSYASAVIDKLVEHKIIEPLKFPELVAALQAAHDHSAMYSPHPWAAECARRLHTVALNYLLSPASADAWLESLQ